jgi:hypothetical protein
LVKNTIGAGNEGQRRHDHIVAGTNAEGVHRRVQCRSAAVYHHRFAGIGITREGLFKFSYLGPGCEPI